MSKTNKVGRPKVSDKDRKKPTDIIKCDICEGKFQRSCKSRHNKTKIHLACKKIIDKQPKTLCHKQKHLKTRLIKPDLDNIDLYSIHHKD